MHSSATIRTVAIFEGAKGLLVLVAGFGLLALIPVDLQAMAEKAVEHFHLNPASHFPKVFLELASRTTDMKLWGYALGALAYSAFRLAEAYGLWRERGWAEWLAVVSGGIYIPFEVYEIARGKGWIAIAALAINIAIVVVMARALVARRRARSRGHATV